jgi:putative intracellular protease/amidase
VGSRRRRELDQAGRILPGRPKTIALVCHSSGALRHVKTPNGKPLVEGKIVTGFTNGEEEDVGLTKVVPFLVEDELMSLGATFSKVKNWGVHTVADGQLITGQNPASSGPTAKVLIETLNRYSTRITPRGGSNAIVCT